MASYPNLRPEEDRPAGAGRSVVLRATLPVALAVVATVAAAVFFSATQLASLRGAKTARKPVLVAKLLGAPQPDAALVRRPVPGVVVRLRKGGFAVDRR